MHIYINTFIYNNYYVHINKIYICMYENIIEDSIEDMLNQSKRSNINISYYILFFMTYALSYFGHKFHDEIVIDQYKNNEYIKC